jgi:hypothetical protein
MFDHHHESHCVTSPVRFGFSTPELHFRPVLTGSATLALLLRRIQVREIDAMEIICGSRDAAGKT